MKAYHLILTLFVLIIFNTRSHAQEGLPIYSDYLTDNFLESIVEKTAIIAGSGMAGIVSSLLLKRKFEKVYLIDIIGTNTNVYSTYQHIIK